MNIITVRNALIAAGAFYLSWWPLGPLVWAYGKIANGITYTGDFEATVLMPLITGVPVATIAARAGFAVGRLVESRRAALWPAMPALLYAFFGFVGHDWQVPPTLLDRLGQMIGAIFPAITCLVAGVLAASRRLSADGRRHPESAA